MYRGLFNKIINSRWRLLIFPAWLVFTLFLAQIIAVAGAQLFDYMGWSIVSNETISNTILTLAGYSLAIVIAIVVPNIVRKRSTTSLLELGWNRLPYWRDIFLPILAMIFYYILSGLLIIVASKIIPGFNANQTQDVGYDNLSGQFEYLLAFFTLVILVPIAEETLFRGYLYGKLRKKASVVVSILITSILFGIMHLAWNVGVDVFAMSVVSCILREVTGSLWASVMLHSLKNGIAYFFLFIYPLISGTLVK